MIVVSAIGAIPHNKMKKNDIAMVSMAWRKKTYEFHVRAAYFLYPLSIKMRASNPTLCTSMRRQILIHERPIKKGLREQFIRRVYRLDNKLFITGKCVFAKKSLLADEKWIMRKEREKI